MMTRARNVRERLALAIYSRDFNAATAELRLLEATNPKWAVANQRARNLANPPAPLPQCAPDVLPVDGGTEAGISE